MSDIRYTLGRARARLSARPVTPRAPEAGPPDGLDIALLEAVCRDQLGEPPATVQHLHLSPFKAVGGAHRILLTTASGRRWTLVYKECRYGPQASPGSVKLGVVLGPAEYAVYTTDAEALRPLLPTVYLAEELRHGAWYRYLLEDLGNTHRKPVSPRDLRTVAARMDELTAPLEAWARAEGSDSILHYDRDFMLRLSETASEVFEAYRDRTADDLPTAATLRRVLDTVRLPDVHRILPPAIVHGDLNRASVLIGGTSLKVVDWEWTGLGVPHLDLAILLETADSRTTRRALEGFARRRSEVAPGEHLRLFRWARAATCTLNATILAVELIADGPVPRADRSAAVRRFTRMAEEAADRL